MTQTTTLTPTPFTLRGTPLLSEGQSMSLLARTPRLWLHAKVYAEGGENGQHAHATEDHAFLVLQGRATFLRPDDSEIEVGALDGLLLPRGTAYSFRSSGEENLVMVRIGCDATDGVVAAAVDQDGDDEQLTNPWPRAQTARVDPHGTPFPPTSPANGSGAVDGRPIPGAFFGA